MNKNSQRYSKYAFLTLIMLSPALCFALTGDTTFGDINQKLKDLLGGSLGFTFVLFGFLGAAAAVAGQASMKIMFPVFGLTLALHYGPAILEDIFGASGAINSITHPQFNLIDLALLMAASALSVYAKYGRKTPSGSMDVQV
jgi:hypothetical protein